jgi:hypothetical protein
LQEFDYEIKHQAGKDNVVADALSRKNIFGISYADAVGWRKKVQLLTEKMPKPPNAIEKDGFYWKNDKIYIPPDRIIRTQLIQEAHNEAGHGGYHKTMNKLQEQFVWEKMAQQTKDFVQTCETCQKTKVSTQKPYGLLTPIPPPRDKFETMSMDLIGPLPVTNNEMDGILVMVNTFSKLVVLVAIKMTYTAEDIANVEDWRSPILGLCR